MKERIHSLRPVQGRENQNLTSPDPLSLLLRPVQKACEERGFRDLTETQRLAIPHILAGRNVLLIAPTGTGKTEAALLPILSRMVESGERRGITLLYITPLRALNRDMLERFEWWCKRLDLRLAVRHGDTPVAERVQHSRAPPQILITTPETLQAILPGTVLKRALANVKWVVVDEVHELAEDARGSQLAVALERLRTLTASDFQAIGLSATIGSPEEVGIFLVGDGRRCEVIRVPIPRGMSVKIHYPRPEKEDEDLASILYTFPEVASRLRVVRKSIEDHASTLVFTNTRSEAELLANRFRLWDATLPVGIHHGSLSRSGRILAEQALKHGSLKGLICTSSLEMGMDIGLLDYVVQYNSPRQVTRLLQRVGRAGHRLGEVADGAVIAQDSDDALEAMVISSRALRGEVEPVKIPVAPLEVLVHQLAGLCLDRWRWEVEDAATLLRRAHPFHRLSRERLNEALRYMHERMPRLLRFSEKDGFFSKPLNKKPLYEYYFGNLSMIPEEKQYLVLKEEGEDPVGILDEAFVAEYGQPGVKFVEAGSVWRITQIYQNKVFVEPADDPTGAVPTWVGDEIPVPYDVAMEVGQIRRMAEEALSRGRSLEELVEELSGRYGVSREFLSRALAEATEQTVRGMPLPTDRRITIEYWNGFLILNCCAGHMINRTLARILGHVISERYGQSVAVHQDAYRVILSGIALKPGQVASVLGELDPDQLDRLAREAFGRTGIFKRRLIHAARKMGVFSKETESSSISLPGLIEAVRGTPVYDAAMQMVFSQDCDLDDTRRFLRSIRSGGLEIRVLEGGDLSPVSRVGLVEIQRRSDIVPPEKMRRIILEYAKARLLGEAKTLVCVGCWSHYRTVSARELAGGYRCPLCSGTRFGLTSEGEDKAAVSARKASVLSPESRSGVPAIRKILESADLVDRYGFAAVVVQSARGVSGSEAKKILDEGGLPDDRFFERILEAERRAMKRRMLLG